MDQSALELLTLNLAARALAAQAGVTPACIERQQTLIAGQPPCRGAELGERLCALLIAAERGGELPADLAAVVQERLGAGRHLIALGTRAAADPVPRGEAGAPERTCAPGDEGESSSAGRSAPLEGDDPFPGILDAWRFERVFRPTPELAGYGHTTLDLEIPSEERLISGLSHLVGLLLREFGYPQDDWMSTIPLVIDEVVTNAMRHGNSGCASKRVRIKVELDAELFRLTVTDQGRGFHREGVADPREGDRLWRPGGRGLFLIESLMDRVEYRDAGRTVHAEKRSLARTAVAPANDVRPDEASAAPLP